MKKTAFLLILSLTLCLSKPAEPQAGTPQAATNAITQDPAKQKDQPPISDTVKVEPTPLATADVTQKPADPQSKPIVTGSETASQQTSSTKVPIKADDSNKTSDKKDDKTEKIPLPVTEIPNKQNVTEAKAITEKPVPAVPTPEDKSKNETTTAKNEVTTKVPDAKTTEAPKTDKHTLQARGFDGPSFIGGMVLTLGLLAVGFMGFKYYKNQTERNYHTL